MKIGSFSYSKKETVALKNTQFSLQEGETLGIVDKAGAGKAAILKLLMCKYNRYQGTISFEKHNIKNYTLDALVGAIGYVPQDRFLFPVMARDNTRFAKSHLEQAAVEQAAVSAFISQKIKVFPEGYDTMVEERDVPLSGGRKQQISIARTLVVEPELLILDDALSTVDVKTEEVVLSDLKEARQEKITIITAHRLGSITHTKEVSVLDEGKIIERGAHPELLAQKGWYQWMWEKQQLEAKIEGSES